MAEKLGTIQQIWRYPVKSMAGEQLDEVEVTFQGIQGDRLHAFVQAKSNSPFPWLTGRELPTLLQYQPEWVPGDRPALAVRTPSGAQLPVESDDLLAELTSASGREVFRLGNYRGSHDVAPLTFIANATAAHVSAAGGAGIEPRRFRMNFYVDCPGDSPFAEDAWVGKTLRVGETVRIAVTERDRRCAMITLDPDTGEAAPSVLRKVAEENDATAGVYATVLTPGFVRAGDAIVAE